MWEESLKNPSTPDNSFIPKRIDAYPLSKVKFDGNCLRKNNASFLHENVVNLYITYKLVSWSRDLNRVFTLGICLFGAVKLTKNTNPDKYGYSGYGNGFDARSQFLWSDSTWGKNVMFLGVNNSSSWFFLICLFFIWTRNCFQVLSNISNISNSWLF